MARPGHGNGRPKRGVVFRSIKKFMFSDEKATQDLFRQNNQGRFHKAPEQPANRFLPGGATAGSSSRSLGGGIVGASSPTAGHVGKEGASTPVYPS